MRNGVCLRSTCDAGEHPAQRVEKGKTKSIPTERIAALEELGFQWAQYK
jgi:hypothetical protein